jgi:2-oxoisovalerate dehydrogenase E2 component (dihydrolipoyl transacylase)
MKTDFILPDLGEGIVECELVEWRIAEGDHIEEDQPVADVLTDKALVEITAMHTGTVTRLYCQQGDMARVEQPLFEIDVAENGNDKASAESSDEASKPATAGGSVPNTRAPAAEREATAPGRATVATSPSEPAGKVLATPAVRRMARELELDLSRIAGSGKKGRVLKEDLLPYQRGERSQEDEASAGPATRPAAAAGEGDRTEPIRGVRAAMARQMSEAAATIPHFTYSDEVDVTALEALREDLKSTLFDPDLKLTVLTPVMKALALAVRQYPVLNSRVNEDCTEITYLADINIGMAADTPSGLLVPNVKRVQDLSMVELAREVDRLTTLARSGKLSQDDMRGGTISISNIGALGGTVSSPIINKPEVAIVALGRIQSLPRFADDGSVTARRIMHISWAGDHRVIDGATMARFCNLWKSYLEQPATMLAELR